MPWLTTPDVALRYELTGDAPRTLLPRYRVLRYDQRGAGLSEKPRGPFTMADFGRDAVVLMDALGIDTPEEFGMSALGGTPEDLARQVSRELPIWLPVVEASGMVVG